MDSDLYDEFGNYIGPDLDSESEEEDDQNFFEQDDIDVSGLKLCSQQIIPTNLYSFVG